MNVLRDVQPLLWEQEGHFGGGDMFVEPCLRSSWSHLHLLVCLHVPLEVMSALISEVHC